MARSRDKVTKKSSVRKAAKRRSNDKQKISIPMVLNCDGKASDLLPWFVKVVELLSKDIGQRHASKRNTQARGKRSGKFRTHMLPLTLPLALPIEGLEMDTDEFEMSTDGSELSEPSSGSSGKSTRSKSRKQVNAMRRRNKRGLKRAPYAPPRKRTYSKHKDSSSSTDSVHFLSDISEVHITSSTSTPSTASLGAKLVESSQADSEKSNAESSDTLTSSTLTGAIVTGQNEAGTEFDSRRMMFLTAQRAALEAFDAAGVARNKQCERHHRNQFSYNFQEAWDELVKEQNAERHQMAQCNLDTSMEHLYLVPSTDLENSPTSPNLSAERGSSNAATTSDVTIFTHIRNSLHDICHSCLGAQNSSTISFQTGPNYDDTETIEAERAAEAAAETEAEEAAALAAAEAAVFPVDFYSQLCSKLGSTNGDRWSEESPSDEGDPFYI